MPPKLDEVKIMRFKVVGGEAPNAAQIAPKLSPLGCNPKKVGEDIQKATKDFKGIKVMIQLKVLNRVAEVTLLPTAASCVIKEMGEAGRDRKKKKIQKHAGNMTLDQVKQVAMSFRATSKASSFKGVVKEILGAVQSVGGTVEMKKPKEICALIEKGEFEVKEP